MTNTREQLKEAYRLIREDKPEQAQMIIRPILADDPENVHAWWLLAYSVDDPYEVREALNKVLELDPNYSNAPKAREMLQTLEETYFSPEAERAAVTGGDVYETESAESEGGSFFTDTFDYEGEQGTGLMEDDYGTVDDSFFDVSYDEDPLSDDQAEEDDEFEDLYEATGTDAVILDEETRATAEERAGQRSGRGLRVLLLVLLIVILAGVAALVLLMGGDDDEATNPEQLAAVDVESADLDSAIAAAQADLDAAAVGSQPRAVVARSELGTTLFAEFCHDPSRELAQDISLAMQLVTQHAVTAAADIEAVGVSVNRCMPDGQDTLYRAFAPIAAAQRYTEGQFGRGETAWAAYQQRWQKP